MGSSDSNNELEDISIGIRSMKIPQAAQKSQLQDGSPETSFHIDPSRINALIPGAQLNTSPTAPGLNTISEFSTPAPPSPTGASRFFRTRNKENETPRSPASPNAQSAYQTSTGHLSRDFYNKANSAQTKRLVTVAKMYFLDFYYDHFEYIVSRRTRTAQVKESLKKIPEKSDQAMQWKTYLTREKVLLRKRRVKPKHKDFTMITQVGQGGYGQVYLARKNDTKEVCALKILNKRQLMKLDETRHVLTERDILTNTRSEWLVKLLYAFQDVDSVYLAMEFVPGGDYRTLLNNTGVLKPHHARFYISEMFVAVNELHKLGYTHRDLKPENFLIDAGGHIKLTDFGLAAGTVSNDRIESMRIKLEKVSKLSSEDAYDSYKKSAPQRQQMYRTLRSSYLSDVNYANSVVGSPDYMALEVLLGKNYNYTIDYWSLGCMLFETLAGYPPFAGETPEETYANLKSWKNTLRRPRYDDGRYVFSDRTWQLITNLIAAEPYRLRSFEAIKSQPYFAEVDFNGLRSLQAPFIPQLDDEEDAGYFDDFTNEADMAKYKEVLDKKNQIESMADKGLPPRSFVGFTFKHKVTSGQNSSLNLLDLNTLNSHFGSGLSLRSQQPRTGYSSASEMFATLY